MHVQVLLSTFNGEAFLLRQLNSILQQEKVQVSIFIRDDGSQDRTVNIIKEQMKTHPNIQLIEGSNIGVVRSYFALMDAASPTCDFFAFCDQDDVWLPNKLTVAVSKLAGFADAALFASPVWITDDGERILGQTDIPPKPLGLANALVQNRLIGCTIVFNAAALQLVRTNPSDLRRVNMHDWWLYLVVSAFGSIVFHSTPTILYRQHASNVVGLKSDDFKARVDRFKKNQRNCSRQAGAFLEAFEYRLDAQQKALIRCIVDDKSVIERLALALTGPIYRQRWFDNLILKLLLILDRV
jgi:glycosyltransferase involved in cell wall biosynthesis